MGKEFVIPVWLSSRQIEGIPSQLSEKIWQIFSLFFVLVFFYLRVEDEIDSSFLLARLREDGFKKWMKMGIMGLFHLKKCTVKGGENYVMETVTGI